MVSMNTKQIQFMIDKAIMKIKNITFIAILTLLASCATQDINKVPDGIKVANEKQIQNCEF